jgi:type I restriction enzyme S subunit
MTTLDAIVEKLQEGPLPAGWRLRPLGEITSVVNGTTPASGNGSYWGGDIVWITPVDLGRLDGVEIRGSDREITSEGFQSCNLTLVPAGAVVMSSRAPIGHLGIAAVELCTNQGCKSFVPGPEVDSCFLYYALKRSVWKLQQIGSGATFSEVSKTQCEAFEIPLPPLPEQQRIAATLREQMAAVERARAGAQARCDAADALAAACLRAVFDAPKAAKWPTKRLGQVLVPHKEIIHPGDRENGRARFVGLEHLESHTGRRIGSLPLDLARLTGRKPTFRRGQIVYGYLRPYLNKVWIAEFDGCSSVDQFAYEVRSELADVRFVAWFMRSPTYLRRSDVVTTTGQLPRIGIEQIAAVEIGLPSLDEQCAVANEIDRRFTTHQKLRELLCDEGDAIDRMPAALLRQAFAGEL